MITTNDSALITYPNRQQMLALIRTRAAAEAEDCAGETEEGLSAASEPPFPTCVFYTAD